MMTAYENQPTLKSPQSGSNGAVRAGARRLPIERPRRKRQKAAVDALVLLKSDHRNVENLFKSYEKCGPRALQTKRKLVSQIIRELSQHAAIEEQFFYPAVRHAAPEKMGAILEALEEHHVAKWLLSELAPMDPTDERFDAKVAVLIESVRGHVYDEEQELFPEMRANLGRKALTELGGRLQEGKNLAPVRPHPHAADHPPANLIVGAVAGVVDRVRAGMRRK
jgi:hemerythrin-like domain-containing protein